VDVVSKHSRGGGGLTPGGVGAVVAVAFLILLLYIWWVYGVNPVLWFFDMLGIESGDQ
jgi:hypothetical protein